MSYTDGDVLFDQIGKLTETLDHTAEVLTKSDKMIDHYRNINKQQGCEITKLHEDLNMSKEENHQYELDLSNRYRNSTEKSFHVPDNSSSDSPKFNYPGKSNLKKSGKSHSPKVRFKRNAYFQDPNFDISPLKATDSRPNERLLMKLKEDQQLAEEETRRMKRQINMCLKNQESPNPISNYWKTIQDQLEAEHQFRKNQQKEMESFSQEMKSLKDVIQLAKNSKTPTRDANQELDEYERKIFKKNQNKGLENLSQEVTPPKEVRQVANNSKIPIREANQDLDACKRKVIKQKETIRLLAEQLAKSEKETHGLQSNVVDIQPVEEMNSSKLMFLQQQLNEEKNERMKIMKQYSTAQQRLNEVDRERSELLYTLSDVRAEAHSNRLAYEKTSQSVPELKCLLEQSAKQKTEFSDQNKKLQRELEEYKQLISRLTENQNEYAVMLNSIGSEKKRWTNELKETRSRYFDTKKELESAKLMLLEAKSSYTEMEKSKQHLQDRAISTLKSYRSKCRKYEKQIEDDIEQIKTKEIELCKAKSEAKELEIANLKQQREFKEVSYKTEELQMNISEYINKCNQIEDEKNQLESILLQSNDKRLETSALLKEMQSIKDENSILNSELCEERKRRQGFESLCREHYQNNLSLKDENTSLKRQIQEEGHQLETKCNNHIQEITKVEEICKLAAKEEIKVISESNDNLLKKIKIMEENAKQMHEDYNNIKNALGQQEMKTADEITKSKALIRKLRTIADENKNIRKEFQVQKQKFDEKMKVWESATSVNKERNVLLQKHVDNAQVIKSATDGNFKAILDIIILDTDNILNLLSDEEENIIPVKEIPKHIMLNNEVQITGLREKLLSCYSITKTLKERFHQQKILIKRARERIKLQLSEIRRLSNTQDAETLRYKEKLSSMEAIQKNNQSKTEKMIEENNILQKRVSELTEDLEGCTRALYKSIELGKEKKMELNEMDLLNSGHKKDQELEEKFYRSAESAERIDLLTEQLSEAKISLSEIKQDSLDRSEYASRMIETIDSISPSKKHRLYNHDSPLYKSLNKHTLHDNSPLPSFIIDLENSPIRDTSPTKEARHLSFSSQDKPTKNNSPQTRMKLQTIKKTL